MSSSSKSDIRAPPALEICQLSQPVSQGGDQLSARSPADYRAQRQGYRSVLDTFHYRPYFEMFCPQVVRFHGEWRQLLRGTIGCYRCVTLRSNELRTTDERSYS